MNIGKFSYEKNTIPAGYLCSVCKKHGLKLWRDSASCADAIDLYCCDCIKKADHEAPRPTVNGKGRHMSDYGMTDQFWNGVPAVPVEDGDTYWGYTSVPDDGVRWWQWLPTRLL